MASFTLIFDNKHPPISHFFASVKLSILCYIKHVIKNGEFIFFITNVTHVYQRSFKKIYTGKINLLAVIIEKALPVTFWYIDLYVNIQKIVSYVVYF